jgi:ribulose-phosphate 3-epimerase
LKPFTKNTGAASIRESPRKTENFSDLSIEASILSADFLNLGEQAKEAEAGGANGIQVDVMDGHFVPNITFGPGIVKQLRNIVDLYLDVHLMIDNPEKFVAEFASAGADRIIVHQEATHNLHRIIQAINDLHVETGVAVNPGTSLGLIEEVLDFADCIQIMTVNPGFAGQSFIKSQLSKIQKLKTVLDENGFKARIAVDGGIDPTTAPLAVSAGATILVAGSSVYNSKAPVGRNIDAIRQSITYSSRMSR